MTFRVMIVGATGVFGSRLVEQLDAVGGCDVILAGRDEAKAAPLLARGLGTRFFRIDRDAPDIAALKSLGLNVLADAAGPFQDSGFALPEACIAAGVHYIDIADARGFVAGIHRLDGTAKVASVAVISGASSTPALSNAVLDDLTRGWRRIDTVSAAIAPGNRTPRGLSVIQAILSYAGRPVRMFSDGAWREAPGWGLNEKVDLPGLKQRNAALCESPDLDLMVERYRPRVSALFKGGLELGIMHHGLRALSWLVRKGLVKSLRPLSGTLLRAANLLLPFGTEDGGMLVEALGQDASGSAVRARWTLVAKKGVGPNVPIFPALAIVEALAADRFAFRGAAPAAGLLALADFQSHFRRLGIETDNQREELPGPHLFERAIGPAWNDLPEITRRLHTVDPAIVLEGEADVEGAENVLGRAVANLFGLPPRASAVPVRVIIERDGDGERWARHYPARAMRSHMGDADPVRGTVVERIGPFRFTLKLDASPDGIEMSPVAVHWGRLRLPRILLPSIAATERASADGRHLFDVRIAAAGLGRLVHYRGWLRPL